MTSHALTRRAFLGASAATAAGLLSARTASAADDFAGFNVGVQSYTFRNFDLEQMLKKTKELGLKSAEFYSKHIPPDSGEDKIKAILKLCDEYEVKPVG